ncbi:MAG: 2-oxoglutarate dehydrogenase complex dihydrolipoyllysine-residue succinyltransferase, partial [Betaproteobacteria bacterium]
NEVIARIDTSVEVADEAESSVSSSEVVDEKNSAAAVVAMPAARKMAAENGLQISSIQGTGRGGRVTKSDIQAAVQKKDVPAPAQKNNVVNFSAASEGGRVSQRVPMSRLRKRVAERLLQSQASAAILTTFNEVNMQPVIDIRNRYKSQFEKEHGVKLGFMSFFVKAVVAALKKFPIVNASVDGDDIVYHGYFDIGMAVGSPRGLVVPIIRNADQMSFSDVEKQIGDFGQRAQEGRLSIEELSGGTFSISNGGVFGSMLSTPIINPPQSAILGIHATKERPVVENGEIVIRPMNYLALSYDHRIIDGREAVLFLVAIKDALEDPSRLLLDL